MYSTACYCNVTIIIQPNASIHKVLYYSVVRELIIS